MIIGRGGFTCLHGEWACCSCTQPRLNRCCFVSRSYTTLTLFGWKQHFSAACFFVGDVTVWSKWIKLLTTDTVKLLSNSLPDGKRKGFTDRARCRKFIPNTKHNVCEFLIQVYYAYTVCIWFTCACTRVAQHGCMKYALYCTWHTTHVCSKHEALCKSTDYTKILIYEICTIMLFAMLQKVLNKYFMLIFKALHPYWSRALWHVSRKEYSLRKPAGDAWCKLLRTLWSSRDCPLTARWFSTHFQF